LSFEHKRELNALIRAHSTPQKLAERARIILLAERGLGVEETANELGIWRARRTLRGCMTRSERMPSACCWMAACGIVNWVRANRCIEPHCTAWPDGCAGRRIAERKKAPRPVKVEGLEFIALSSSPSVAALPG
jgi:hypothetical protein